MNLTDAKDLKSLLARHGFHFSKSKGQNFLIASWVPERIAESAELSSDVGVLEIGPGVGSLSVELAARAGKLVCVELDRTLQPLLEETLGDIPNIEILYNDVLRLDLAEVVREHFPGLRPVVCANLPYNITSPILSALLEAECFETITVMVQREVAHRLTAKPKTSDYGAFTVFINWYAESSILFDVPPSCFMPQPKVTSSILQLRRRSAPPVDVKDKKTFFRVVHAAFGQRRKTLVNALSSGLNLPKDIVESAVISLGLSPTVRGEALSMSEFADLSNLFLDNLPVKN